MWQRWNQTTHIFEVSTNEGASWSPLPLNGSIINEGTIGSGFVPAPGAHHASHETGGADALAALSGNIITTGTVADARLSSNVPLKNTNNIFTGIQTGTGQIRTHVSAGATVNISNTTFTNVSFNTENYDIGNCWTSGNPTQLVCPSGGDGYYLVIGIVAFSTNSAGARFARLAKNGVSIYQQYYPTTSGDQTLFQIFMLTHIVAADYLQLVLYQSSGSTLDGIGSGLVFVKLW